MCENYKGLLRNWIYGELLWNKTYEELVRNNYSLFKIKNEDP